ncbi:GSCOCG00001512001-RA-CDS [Cotesia congregata]|nr:GSCOCG00001512001-RA-CDS [Cotesia congregata]
MSKFSRFQKFAAVLGVGTVSGAAAIYYNGYVSPKEQYESPYNNTPKFPGVGELTPSIKWDSNWDRRDPKSLIKPKKLEAITDENKYNAEIEAHKPRAARHVLLIRHGQYNLSGSTDTQRILTELGRNQADCTGKRLQHLALPYSQLVRSTMTRAQETAKIIETSLPNVPVVDDSLLVEGCPILPEPPFGGWRPGIQYFQDGPRIEAAFRKYFHRASPKQEKDSYTIIVCHANVIRDPENDPELGDQGVQQVGVQGVQQVDVQGVQQVGPDGLGRYVAPIANPPRIDEVQQRGEIENHRTNCLTCRQLILISETYD